jgi:hypothetical protein
LRDGLNVVMGARALAAGSRLACACTIRVSSCVTNDDTCDIGLPVKKWICLLLGTGAAPLFAAWNTDVKIDRINGEIARSMI